MSIAFLLQGLSEAGSGITFWRPFLTIEADRKLTLHHLSPPLEDGASTREDPVTVVADQSCAMEKWVHIGCEVRLCGLRIEISNKGLLSDVLGLICVTNQLFWTRIHVPADSSCSNWFLKKIIL